MTKIKWADAGKKQLEARVYCRQCERSNLITATDMPAFWDSFKDRPVRIYNCTHCGLLMRIKINRDGLEYLL